MFAFCSSCGKSLSDDIHMHNLGRTELGRSISSVIPYLDRREGSAERTRSAERRKQ